LYLLRNHTLPRKISDLKNTVTKLARESSVPSSII